MTAFAALSSLGRTSLALARELARVVPAANRAESWRLRLGPAAAIASARARGLREASRDAGARARLRRSIRVVDRLWPGGPNCFRRVLMEIACDAGAAREPVSLGFRVAEGASSGHAWLGGGGGDPEARPTAYNAAIVL